MPDTDRLIAALCNDNPDPARGKVSRDRAAQLLRVQQFAQAVVAHHFNATAAYEALHPEVGKRKAGLNAHRLMRTGHVQIALRDIVEAAKASAAVDFTKMLGYSQAMLETSVFDLFDVDAEGRITNLNPKKASRAARLAVSSIGISNEGGIAIKMGDKTAALRFQLEVLKVMRATGQVDGIDRALTDRLQTAKRRRLLEYGQRKVTQMPKIIDASAEEVVAQVPVPESRPLKDTEARAKLAAILKARGAVVAQR